MQQNNKPQSLPLTKFATMKAKILFFAMCFATVAMAQTTENDTTVVLDSESVTSNSNWVIDGDNVYLESTSAKVGIRTDSPQEALHVNGFIRGEGPGGALRINTDYGITTIGAVSGNYSYPLGSEELPKGIMFVVLSSNNQLLSTIKITKQ